MIMRASSVLFILLFIGMLLLAVLNSLLASLPSRTSVVDQHLQAFRPVHRTIANLSACLLIKDDNDILNEWIAYHYFAADLRHLVVAVDPSSLTDPRPLLDQWQRSTDLQVIVWSDDDFMPESFLQRGWHIPPKFVNSDPHKSKWHANDTDPEIVRADTLRIENHRFRQVTFLSACLRHVRDQQRSLVMHIDTDEYIVLNPKLRFKGQLYHAGLGLEPHQPSLITKVLNYLYQHDDLYTKANLPCLSMPRLLFGSVEDEQPRLTVASLNASSFETLRWRHHTAYDDQERNAQPKVIVDVSRVNASDEMFQPKPFSIHRPSKALCRRIDQIKIEEAYRFPLTVNHYVGPWERYYARNDSRRSATAYHRKAHVDAGEDGWLAPWLEGFVSSMGEQRAAMLLGRQHLVWK